MDFKCVFCLLRSYENYLEMQDLSDTDKLNVIKRYIENLGKMDFSLSTPIVTQRMNSKMREFYKSTDPYIKVKKDSNEQVMSLLDDLRNTVNSSKNPFLIALKLAIAGNIIDYGVFTQFDIKGTIDRVLKSDFAIDHSEMLEKKIQEAETILYLGDNAGEIVLDKLFLETIAHKNVYFAVRGGPILNDATEEDALFVGINYVAKIITNGDDAPSTIIESSSDEFLEVYNKADLIISKGQGNFEGLINNKREDLFFLLMVKCDYIANRLGVNKNDFVVKKNEK